jgi:Spy/CpxP family protein refolding chaperone
VRHKKRPAATAAIGYTRDAAFLGPGPDTAAPRPGAALPPESEQGGVPMTRSVLWVAAAFAMIAICAVRAEDRPASDTQGQANFEENWRQLVMDNMDLTDEQRAKVTPLYAEYRQAIAKINQRAVNLILAYGEKYDSLDDAEALKLLNAHLDQQAQRLQLERDYIPRFEGVLPAKKVARLFQLENKLTVGVAAYLAQRVPLIDTGATTRKAPETGSSEKK